LAGILGGRLLCAYEETGADAKSVGAEETNPRRPHVVVTEENSSIGTKGG